MDLDKLQTELRNEESQGIETKSTGEIISIINSEDQKVAYAVRESLKDIEKAVDIIYEKVLNGGRLIYIGAGTSGRLGVLDASECPPTYGVSYDLIQGIIAGGDRALRFAAEGAEDDEEAIKDDLKKINFSDKDVLMGIAASGRTPYVVSGLKYANEIGATTVSMSNVKNSLLSQNAQYPIEVIVGPEIVTGSSRMKAGTSQKMVLNMITTTLMIKLGKIYNGYMVDVRPSNEKLVNRSINIISSTTGISKEDAKKYLEKSGMDVKLAIIMSLGQIEKDVAEKLLQENGGNVALVIRNLKEE
ncbi:MAG: N-acetylmuramic acid 6-phosphate etherase [Tissierellia bacterium]|nr:N-acetylmuramic acid 6-phosphate etherase [Tissierellia bacterium]